MNENEELKAVIQLVGHLYLCVERMFRFQTLEDEKIALLKRLCEEKKEV